MRRQIVYLGGFGHRILDQSAAVVADRIARAVQERLSDVPGMAYRVHVEADAHAPAPDLAVDIATIELRRGDTWTPVIDVLEVRYLDRFARSVSRLSPLGRALKALSILWMSWWTSHKARRAAIRPGRRGWRRPRLEQLQATWLTMVLLLSVGYLIYWVGLAAILAAVAALAALGIRLDTVPVWLLTIIVPLLGLAESVRRNVFDRYEQWAAETFASLEYQIDDQPFLAVPNAVLDAIELARQRQPGPIDLLGFSLGSFLSTDVLFPRQARQRIWSPPAEIDNWITVGFPYDLVRATRPDYFRNRQPPTVRLERWLNIVVEHDFLGTGFEPGDGRGVHVAGSNRLIAPDVSLSFRPDGLTRPGRLAWLTPRRLVTKHTIYWNDQDPRAPSCFRMIVDEAGWTRGVLDLLDSGRHETGRVYAVR